MKTCPFCDAAEYGNLTCRTCRQHMREMDRCPCDLLDLLDAANIATVPPVGAEDIQRFVARLWSGQA
jgi:hypothetical protein